MYFSVTRKEVRQYIKPFVIHPDSMNLIYASTALLLVSKGLAISSPYILKLAVDAMTIPNLIDFKMVTAGILLSGTARVLSSLLHEIRMVQIAQLT